MINSLLIKPAGPDCNIACRYCFYSCKKELFKDRPVHRMSEETAERTIKSYLATAGPQASLGFQGGEPTLCGIDFFRKIIEYCKTYKRPMQQVSLALQTNGLLLDEEWVKLLSENQVLVGLSIDGPEDIHNAYRRTFGDEPTHHRVAKIMQMLKEHNVTFNTLSVITKANVHRANDLIDYFLQEGSGYMQFIPCVEVIDGKIAPYSPTPEEYGQFLIEAFDRWYNNGYPNFYIRLFDEMLIAFVEYRSPSCYFAPLCAANLVVEHTGDLYPCDFFVEPQWYLGNINQENFEDIIKNPVLDKFIHRKPKLDDRCNSCEWRSICWGDCPKYRFDTAGQPIHSAYFCEAYKMFFEHAAPKMREIKRQLHTEGNHPRYPIWKHLEQSLKRNDPCPCGSDLKFKKCCQPIKGI